MFSERLFSNMCLNIFFDQVFSPDRPWETTGDNGRQWETTGDNAFLVDALPNPFKLSKNPLQLKLFVEIC